MEADKKVIKFYNTESEHYSDRRYKGDTETYVQYFFKQRRDIVLKMLSGIIENKSDLSLLDIACADGVLTRDIDSKFPKAFAKLVGTDLAPQMVEVARKITVDRNNISFYVKDECPVDKFDIVLGLGYLSKTIFEDEMSFLLKRLAENGYYICTFASKDSIFARLKLADKYYIKDYGDYKDYDVILSRYFSIVEEIPYGFFVPKLWSVPVLARIVQPIFDKIMRPICPSLFHEKVYLLKLKSN